MNRREFLKFAAALGMIAGSPIRLTAAEEQKETEVVTLFINKKAVGEILALELRTGKKWVIDSEGLDAPGAEIFKLSPIEANFTIIPASTEAANLIRHIFVTREKVAVEFLMSDSKQTFKSERAVELIKLDNIFQPTKPHHTLRLEFKG